MCGFAGFLGFDNLLSENQTAHILKCMANTLIKRGPDSDGYWIDMETSIAISHRRLAIVDLSVAGHQPMSSNTGRYVIAFNGEIYNHLDLRMALSRQNAFWRGHSDTETLLAGFETWGIEATISKTIGMFAIAVWDRLEKTLTLIRDRIGEKPLYYGWQGSGQRAVLLFGSELKSFRRHPSFEAEIDRESLALYMRHNCIPEPHSIYKGIFKLEPGAMRTFSLAHQEGKLRRYWSAVDMAENGVNHPFSGSPQEATEILEKLLIDAIGKQMIADVPLGAFLSGGIDSTTVVALMQSQSLNPIKTFSIGFNEEKYNEAAYAKAIAKHLGTDHTEMYVTPEQAMAVIPKIPSLWDEPFSDSSQIPTFLVASMAKEKVTVTLSGDASDELFCGYNRYMMTARYWRFISKLPFNIRKIFAHSICATSPQVWNKIIDPLKPILPKSIHAVNVGDKLHKGANVLCCHSIEALYLKLITHWENVGDLIQGVVPDLDNKKLNMSTLTVLSDIEKMMLIDLMTYLTDDILVKVDRAAMGVSLETRVPFLDHRVTEFAWSLPFDYKYRDGQTKWPLRQILYKHVPKKLIERPKMGFGIPIDSWLRGPLRAWAEELLDEARLKNEGFINPEPIRKKWNEHVSGNFNWQHHLWDVLMFQSWLQEEKSRIYSLAEENDLVNLA